ncbi:hypothetical protein [Cupriavidus metallidurans]
MKLDLTQEWGVVQQFRLEADTFRALQAACVIALTEHSKATHFAVISDADGGNALALRWTEGQGAYPLPFELSTPEEVAGFIRSWLEKRGLWPKQIPSTDGSVKKGYRFESRGFTDLLTVKPMYIVYGK